MSKMIFLNLPVRDVPRATAFYEALGAQKDARFCDGSTSCMVISETIFAMLLSHERFGQFTSKKIVDARDSAEVLLCLTASSRAEVDAMVAKAVSGGGKADPCATQDYGFMYGRSFEDLDGHIWEVTWMDLEAALKAKDKAAA